MTQIQPFVFPTTGQQVRTVLVNDEPWFVAADVCAVLEISNPSQAVSYLDDDEKQQVSPTLISSEGRGAAPWLISEAGLFSLILRSRKPDAKAFKRWVTHEVLPSLRKTGSYSIPLADPLAEIERQTVMTMRAVALAKRERIRAEIAESLVAELVSPANAWEVLGEAGGDFSAADAAKILSRDPAINLGERTLLGVLFTLGWAYRQRGDRRPRAYQSAVNSGRLAELPVRGGRRPGRRTRTQVRVTVKGLLELHRRYGSGKQLAITLGDLNLPGIGSAAQAEVRALPARDVTR